MNLNVMFCHKSRNGITKRQNKDFIYVQCFPSYSVEEPYVQQTFEKMVNSGSSKTLLFKNTNTMGCL